MGALVKSLIFVLQHARLSTCWVHVVGYGSF
jgi:hypothetical protein